MKYCAKRTEITEVSRQIRRESLPIIYSQLEFHIFIDKFEDPGQHARHWLKNTVDPAVLEIVGKFQFFPNSEHFGFVELNPAHPQQPLSYEPCGRCKSARYGRRPRTCNALVAYFNQIELKLRELDMFGNERSIMTKERLESLIEVFYTTRKELDEWLMNG